MKCSGKLGFTRFLLSSHILHMHYQCNPETLLPSPPGQTSYKILMVNPFRLATRKTEAYHVEQPPTPSFELSRNSFRIVNTGVFYLLN